MLDRLRQLSPVRQLLAACLAFMVLACLLWLAWTALRPSYRPLFTDLKPADAAAIVGELQRKKAPYKLADGGTTILVPDDQVDATRLGLMDGAVALKGTVGFELFNKSDLGLTDFAQRINYQRALQGELERTIMTLDGVETARVHLSLGEDRVFRQDRVPPKASVTLHLQTGAAISAAMAAGIQRLVAAAIPNLQAGDVVILDEHGQTISVSGIPNGTEQPEPAATAVDAYYAARIQSALRPAYGTTLRAVVHALQSEDADLPPSDAKNRDFPLEVSIIPLEPLDPASLPAIRDLVSDAVGFQVERGDRISFVQPPRPVPTAIPSQSSVPATAMTRTSPAASGTSGPGPSLFNVWSILATAVAAMLLWLVIRARSMPRRLSPAEKQDLSERLKRLLDQMEHADGQQG